jgi:hypothetical protein
MKATSLILATTTILSAISTPAAPVQPAVSPKAVPFDLRQVRLLDGPFKDAQKRDRQYLHDLDSDRLLHNFRVTSGLPSAAVPYGGWEAPKCELRGHTVEHYLSACALMYASTGDEKLKAKADYIVAGLAKCQAKSGFLSAYPESFFDRVDDGKPVWAPYSNSSRRWMPNFSIRLRKVARVIPSNCAACN